ncbi:Helicase associated domain protein [Streptomyces sp. NPDC008317]|uniref:helicase associated domain-containing protein n=1 Tax=Streptomyces sp. NPDC008317 TaxID=3364827 RepID=UPI0036E5B848
MPDVDAVVFAAPRYCVIDAIQAIGRGLRQPPGAGKKTTLVIPVYLHNGADIAGLLHDSQFANLLTLLQALRAHDGSFMDRIALPARTRAARTRSSAGGRDVFYAQPERAAQLARVLGLEITVPAIGTWHQALTAATGYHASFGHLDVPADYTDPGGFALGECIAAFRLRRLLGRLPAGQQQALDALGMLWAARPATFQTMLGHARAWAAEHGHLTVPVKEDIGGHRLGAWLAAQRRKAATGKLPSDQQQALEALDPHWNPPWHQQWQRAYLQAKALSPGPGGVWRPASDGWKYKHHPDSAIVDWIHRQRLNFFRLPHQGQRDLLLAIGIPPLPDGVYYDSAHDSARHAFYDALGHATAYLAREGHLNVPRDHREPRWAAP